MPAKSIKTKDTSTKFARYVFIIIIIFGIYRVFVYKYPRVDRKQTPSGSINTGLCGADEIIIYGNDEDDLLKPIDGCTTILYGREGDDIFVLTYNLAKTPKTFVADFGDGEDILVLDKRYSGDYMVKKRQDGSVDIEVLRTDVGDYQMVANIKGQSVKKLVESGFRESRGLVRYVEQN